MTEEFMLQWAHSCPGYKRFFLAWCRLNNPETCPTEKEWERFENREPEYNNLSLNDLLETFPEAVKMAKTKLVELKERLPAVEAECNEDLNQYLVKYSDSGPEFMQFLNELAFVPIDGIDDELGKVPGIKQQIEYWEKIVRMDEFKRKPPEDGTITDSDILRAKEFPLISLVKPNAAGFICCPFHNEKSGSCKIYKDNRYHCFGCGADGDVIDFMMKETGLTFINAVKKILNK